MKEKAIICDIDGVILDSSQVFKEIEELGLKGDAKWDYFDWHANGLRVFTNKEMVELIYTYYCVGITIVFLTARSERIKNLTAFRLYQDFKLYDCELENFDLLMRSEGDYSPSAEVKEKHLMELKKKYEILCAFDDDESNCEMFRKNNILTFKV